MAKLKLVEEMRVACPNQEGVCVCGEMHYFPAGAELPWPDDKLRGVAVERISSIQHAEDRNPAFIGVVDVYDKSLAELLLPLLETLIAMNHFENLAGPKR